MPYKIKDKFLCFFGFHKWGKWRKSRGINVTEDIMKKSYCKKCGKMRLRW